MLKKHESGSPKLTLKKNVISSLSPLSSPPSFSETGSYLQILLQSHESYIFLLLKAEILI